MYQVIIIEDDPMVSSINRQYVELNKYLRVAGQFNNGQEALDYLCDHPVDLIILDMYMPVMDGASFIQELRECGNHADVIMVTAANDTERIKQMMSYGILDYLVKPFEYVRFNHALSLFMQRREAFMKKTMTQQELDSLMLSNTQAHQKEEMLNKGLQEKTLGLIMDYMKESPGKCLTSEEIAEATGLSRVTVRRYMNYLLENHEIISNVNYTTGGRPSIMYQYVTK